MRVKFWGTRGSIATPGPGTNRFGGNTSCVELLASANTVLIFDCGTGARLLGADLIARGMSPIHGHILIGHTHWDHIQGFPFFAPVFMPGNDFTVYAPRGAQTSLQDVLAGQMEFTYFPVELGQLPSRLKCNELGEGTHAIGGVRVLAQYLHHPAITLGYRVETDDAVVLYVNDHEPFADVLWRTDEARGHPDSIVHPGDRRHAHFMTDADLVIHDAQYTAEEYRTKKAWGHSPYEYVVEVAAAAGVRRLALTHHDPTHDDKMVAEIEERAQALAKSLGSSMEVFCAWEGCELDLSSNRPRRAFTLETLAPESATLRLRILVVDDDPDMRRLTMIALARDGHTLTEAADGRDAIRKIDAAPPEFVVLDLDMPDVDGIGVLKHIRANPDLAHLPVLILTSHDEETYTRRGFELGATDYLTKPFSMPQLAARVRACLARGAMR